MFATKLERHNAVVSALNRFEPLLSRLLLRISRVFLLEFAQKFFVNPPNLLIVGFCRFLGRNWLKKLVKNLEVNCIHWLHVEVCTLY